MRIYIAVPAFDLGDLKRRFGVNLLTQHLDDTKTGSSTGWLAPEIAKLEGARGSILNHSEHRLNLATITNLVDKTRELRMTSIVCARTAAEVSRYASVAPDFIAIEPPELIGTGKSVSKYSPSIISRSRAALKKASAPDRRTRLLCGAGIVNGDDVRRAIELGSDGVLVASGVVLAENRRHALSELLRGFAP